MSSAFDFARVPGPAPQEIIDNGGEGILTYSFRGQTREYLDAIVAAGLHDVYIWERNTDSIFNGYDYAVSECRLHEANIPAGKLSYVACDTNDGGVGGRLLAPFLQGWSDTTREPTFGVYGSSGAIRQAQAFGGKCQRYWGVVNWIVGGGPNNAPENIDYWRDAGAHLIQLIGSPIPGTDENLILKPEWATIGDDDMPLTDADLEKLWNYIFIDKVFGKTRFDAGVARSDTLATWMQEQTKNVIDTVDKHIDEKLAGLPAGGGGGVSEADLHKAVRAELDKTHLTGG